MTVTFCGHSTVYPLDLVQRWLHEVIEGLIVRGARKFYLGGYGTFDQMAAAAVWEQKRTHPEITSVLVLPYLDRKVSATEYDYTTYPPLENVPRRFAISRRNRWMVDNSDILVAFVTHDWGGAATTLKYAERKKKEIIRYTEGSS